MVCHKGRNASKMISSSIFILRKKNNYQKIPNLYLACPVGRWGNNCENDCECQNDSTCDPYDGKCTCTRGWIGRNCDEKCPPTSYGHNCEETCRCKNGGSCHHISGECHCAPGYTGPLWVPANWESSVFPNKDTRKWKIESIMKSRVQ